jgi:hypothetical protein
MAQQLGRQPSSYWQFLIACSWISPFPSYSTVYLEIDCLRYLCRFLHCRLMQTLWLSTVHISECKVDDTVGYCRISRLSKFHIFLFLINLSVSDRLSYSPPFFCLSVSLSSFCNFNLTQSVVILQNFSCMLLYVSSMGSYFFTHHLKFIQSSFWQQNIL